MEETKQAKQPENLTKEGHLNIMNVLDNLAGVGGQSRTSRDIGWNTSLNKAGKGLTDLYIQYTNNPNPATKETYIKTLINLRQNIRQKKYPTFNGLDNHLKKLGVGNLE